MAKIMTIAEIAEESEEKQEVAAVVRGEPYTALPQDLYIPPDALEVILETFSGPMDLLIYLIKRQNLDILDIPIAEVTRQYVDYIEMMQELRLELAAEYLVMAAMLAEIKSRMLLPRELNEEGEEDDPRAELVRRLQEYERFKQAAEDLESLPRIQRDIFTLTVEPPEMKEARPLPTVEMKELLFALQEVMRRAEMYAHCQIQREGLSVHERMSIILGKVKADRFTPFAELFAVEEGRMGIVISFVAILELIRQSMIEIVQSEPFAPIHVKALVGECNQ